MTELRIIKDFLLDVEIATLTKLHKDSFSHIFIDYESYIDADIVKKDVNKYIEDNYSRHLDHIFIVIKKIGVNPENFFDFYEKLRKNKAVELLLNICKSAYADRTSVKYPELTLSDNPIFKCILIPIDIMQYQLNIIYKEIFAEY